LVIAGAPVPDEATREPLYRAIYQGHETQIAATRRTVDWLTAELHCAVAADLEEPRPLSSEENLRRIGRACIDYKTNHNQKLPPNIDVLLKEGLIKNAKVFQNPDLKEHFPGGDYALVPMPDVYFGPNNVLAYEKYAEAAPPKEINVLYLYGGVVKMPLDQFRKALAETMRMIEEEAKAKARAGTGTEK
jgi:hypothetical protein